MPYAVVLWPMLIRLYRKPPRGPGAGGGVQTPVGVAVAVFSEALKIVGESHADEGAATGGQARNDRPD